MTPWRVLVQERAGHEALATAVAAAGGVLDQAELIVRQDIPAPDVARRLPRTWAWAAVTSPHTVAALDRAGLAAQVFGQEGARLAAVGEASCQALLARGWNPDLAPVGGGGGAALGEAFPEGQGTVLLPAAHRTAGTLEPMLRAKGWTVVHVPVYETVAAATVDPAVARRWAEGRYAALVVTAPSVARAAATLLGASLPAVAVGPTSDAAARAAGFPRVVQAGSTRPTAILTAIRELIGATP